MEPKRGVFRTRGISLDPDHSRAVDWIADQDGHGNASRVVQRLIEAEAARKLGPDWREAVRERAADLAEAVA